ncbi:MAG: formyltransferase family protein [Methylophilaceae bacterium]|nr:formyltransferase family protein [Methylophilaceae bacterium]
MKILVFVSKWIGMNCLDVLFSKFNEDEYTFVVSNPNADEIISKIENYNHKYMLLNDSTISRIESMNENHFDWLLNLWGGYIFNENLLSRVNNTLNIHPSFLPYGKGRDPVVWAIRFGHPAGVTLHEITAGVDEGPIFYQEEIEYSFPITGKQLYSKVVKRCWESFNEQWPNIRATRLIPKPQNTAKKYKTFRRVDLDSDNFINLNEDSLHKELFLKILAHDFGDEYSLSLKYKDKFFSVKLLMEEKND